MQHTALRSDSSCHRRRAVTPNEAFVVRRALVRSVAAAGERLIKNENGVGEFDSLDRSHVSSRSDLEGTALIVRYVPEFMSRESLPFALSFENEELPLLPFQNSGQRQLRLVIDPVDGTKAFDNYMCAGDLPVPRPPSAVSVAAVCPLSHALVASAVYCFDLGEVYSCCLLELGGDQPKYMAFRDNALLSPVDRVADISAKRRILNGNYNSRALLKLAELELGLMDRGLNPVFGGLTGSSATDIINVVRGSFAACLDVRALCGGKGSVPYWYDIAGAVGVARGRGLRVRVTGADGIPLEGGDHAIYTPVSFIAANPEVFDTVQRVVHEQLVTGLPAVSAVA